MHQFIEISICAFEEKKIQHKRTDRNYYTIGQGACALDDGEWT